VVLIQTISFCNTFYSAHLHTNILLLNRANESVENKEVTKLASNFPMSNQTKPPTKAKVYILERVRMHTYDPRKIGVKPCECLV